MLQALTLTLARWPGAFFGAVTSLIVLKYVVQIYKTKHYCACRRVHVCVGCLCASVHVCVCACVCICVRISLAQWATIVSDRFNHLSLPSTPVLQLNTVFVSFDFVLSLRIVAILF